MANTKIHDLTATGGILGTDEIETSIAPAAGSRRATIAQLRQSAGTLPTITVGAEFTSTAVPTATLPSGVVTNDILVLCIQSANDSIVAAPTGYTQLGPANGIGVAAAAGSTKLSLFWKRAGASESAPTLTDTGDHTYGVMFLVRGCPTTGDPFRMLGQNWKFTASTTGTADKGTTRADNSLIVNIFAHALDQAGAAASSPTNADLTSVTEQFDDSTTDGTGGGIAIISGVKATAGEVAATTVTWSGSTVDVSTTLSFPPADAFPVPRGPEVMTFIGSPPDLNDTWVKPYGARKVFVQLVDGGGGGSGGNTTTTAAGGGGGGGGGYDEAWFEAEELGATATVHAGKGGAAGTGLLQAGNIGVVSGFDTAGSGPLISTLRNAGVAATAAASADGGNGGTGAGRGDTALAVQTTRISYFSGAGAVRPSMGQGAPGGSGTTAPVGGSNAEWGGGGGESGADTDAATTSANNGWSLRGGGGGSSGRTNTNASVAGFGGGAGAPAAQGAAGTDSTRMPYGGSGGNGGGSATVLGGRGGFPGGGGGGGAGVAGGFGGAGGHGCVMVTTFF